ncbi:sulfurtransferase [Planctomycetota bacterium]|nr:sulfurtransferase [Planctomycetota bacterium]
MPATIDPAAVQSARSRGEACLLIDVRTPGEFAAVHAVGVESMPLDRLDPQAVRSRREAFGADCPVYVLCRSGGRATKAVEQLTAAGLTSCIVVAGGTDAWIAAGLPVERGRGVISLERQVRIAAGSLVVIGVTLGLTVHPGAFALAGFVGAGLVFAGITDWCGMGLLMAKMPWNQGSAPAAAKPAAA